MELRLYMNTMTFLQSHLANLTKIGIKKFSMWILYKGGFVPLFNYFFMSLCEKYSNQGVALVILFIALHVRTSAALGNVTCGPLLKIYF